MTDNVLKGKRIVGSARAPKQINESRTCAAKTCGTVLSRYNRREFCFAHAPAKFPRVRGRIVSENS